MFDRPWTTSAAHNFTDMYIDKRCRIFGFCAFCRWPNQPKNSLWHIWKFSLSVMVNIKERISFKLHAMIARHELKNAISLHVDRMPIRYLKWMRFRMIRMRIFMCKCLPFQVPCVPELESPPANALLLSSPLTQPKLGWGQTNKLRHQHGTK